MTNARFLLAGYPLSPLADSDTARSPPKILSVNKLTWGVFAAVAFAALATLASPSWAQSAPTVSGTVARKVHGVAGTFDLPLATDQANPSVEPRSGPAHTIVFTFNK